MSPFTTTVQKPQCVSHSWGPGPRICAAIDIPHEAVGNVAPFDEISFGEAGVSVLRNLILEGHATFTARDLSVLDRCRHYRASLHAIIESASNGGEGQTGDEATIAGLRAAAVVWEFCEMVYFSPHEEARFDLPSKLADWLAANFDEVRDELNHYLNSDKSDDCSFWSLVCRLAAVGRRQEAADLCGPRMKDGDEDLGLQIASSALLDTVFTDVTAAKLDGRWRKAQEDCLRSFRDFELDDATPGPGRLLLLLSGDRDAAIQSCQTWAEMLVAAFTYDTRTMTSSSLIVHALQEAADITATHFPVDSSDVLGQALAAAADGNPSQACLTLSGLGTEWHAAHLSDLFEGAGMLEFDFELAYGVRVREHCLLSFARGLECRGGLWRIALDYFLACERQGLRHAEELLFRVPITSTAGTAHQKILHIAATLGLESVYWSVCSRLGASALASHNLSGAVFWFGRGGDNGRAEHAARKALLQAEEQGFSSERTYAQLRSVVDAVWASGNKPLQEKLEFVRFYADFQSAAVEADAHPDAGNLALTRAVHLVSRSGGLPKEHWILVIYDITCLLSEIIPKLSTTEELSALFPKDRTAIYSLLRALQATLLPPVRQTTRTTLSKRLRFISSEAPLDADQTLLSLQNNLLKLLPASLSLSNGVIPAIPA